MTGVDCFLEGPGAPAFPTFAVTEGLTGSAIQQKCTIVIGHVRKDPRYLTTFGGTLSEIVIPILGNPEEKVIATIEVESEQENAFSQQDRQILERCAHAARPLWDGGNDLGSVDLAKRRPVSKIGKSLSLCWN